MKFQENKYFKDLTTFKVGGKIKYYAEAKNLDEIKQASLFAKENNLPLFVIGGGSDFLASDDEFNGVVIKYSGDSYRVDGELVTGDAGISWDKIVEISVNEGLAGLECLSGIPGTVGASPIQNIGAYGAEMSSCFYELKALKLETGDIVTFSKDDCKFGYRESIFKTEEYWQKYLILSVTFKLSKNASTKINYDSLKGVVHDGASIKEIRDAVLKVRAEKLENPKEHGNAGSFFKNPIIESEKKEEILSKYPDAKVFPFEEKFKVSAGWLIEKAGLKGKEFGGAGVSSKHSLILINRTGKATAREIYDLSEKIISEVYKKFGVRLEREVQLINFNNKYSGKKIAVIGLGIEGKDAINYLIGKGAFVTLFDKKEESELDFENIDKTKISLVCGSGYFKNGLAGFDYIIRSPGVYPLAPEILKAKDGGAIVTSAVKIFFEEAKGKIIGVTGTKGKGTTSTLIYEILKADGRDVYLSGNIGKPSLELLPLLTEESWTILELSSFQLMDMEASPHIAVVLNITEDHMDWHKNRGEYVDAKKNIVKFQKESDFAVINDEYETPKSFELLGNGQKILFSKKTLEEKYKKDLLLKGEHNLENIAAAVETVKTVGVSEEIILNTVRGFKGLEHRLELVAEKGGVKYYNDSFATGPQPTIAAINSFTEGETLVLGGSDKGLSYNELGDLINSKKNIKNIILIGATGPKIKEYLDEKGAYKIIDLGINTNMNEIVEKAKEVSRPGEVVVLSPASASFDMFKNYKDRGNKFKEAVLNLKK